MRDSGNPIWSDFKRYFRDPDFANPRRGYSVQRHVGPARSKKKIAIIMAQPGGVSRLAWYRRHQAAAAGSRQQRDIGPGPEHGAAPAEVKPAARGRGFPAARRARPAG